MTVHVIIIGCGMLGSGALTVLCTPPFARHVANLRLIDPGKVRKLTLLTVPEYAGSLCQPKTKAAAKFARERLPRSARVEFHKAFVQAVDFHELLGSLGTGDDDLIAVVLTPDSWPARLDAMWQLRLAAGAARCRIAVVQMGVDQSLVQASVFGNSLDDPCMVCRLASPALPISEPCVVLRPGGQLLRGPLSLERQAAIALFGEILDDLIARRSGTLNRKILLRLTDQPGVIERFNHCIDRCADCWGPHDRQAAPLPLDELLRM